MAIEFRCVNPSCDKLLSAPDHWAGKSFRCPVCKAEQAVPATSTASRAPAEPPPPAPPPLPGEQPQVGHPGAAAPAPGSSFVGDCADSLRYAFSNISSVFKLVFFFVLVYGAFSAMFSIFRGFLLTTAGGRVLLAGISGAVQLIVGGYFLRFYLDAVIGSLEGADQAPDVPAFNLNELFLTGLKGLGMVVVYVLPVVTLPLLPVGYLALGYTNDSRAFHVGRVSRAAIKHPGPVAGLWIVCLLWLVLIVGAVALVATLTFRLMLSMMASGCFGILVGLLIYAAGAVVNATIAATLTTALFRCFGMLGRHYPDVLDELDEPAGWGTIAAWVGGGVGASAVVVFVLVPMLLSALALSLGGLQPPSPGPEVGTPDNVGDRYVRRQLDALKRAKRLRLTTRLRAVGQALKLYAVDHQGRFPQLPAELGRYIGPVRYRPETPAEELLYVPGLSSSDRPTTIIVYTKVADADGRRTYLQISGEVKRVGEPVFRVQIARQGGEPAVAWSATRPAPGPATRPATRPEGRQRR